MFFENVEPESNSSYAVLPYINGSTEPLKRLLKRHGIRTTTKPLRTLEQDFPSPKDRPLPEKKTNVIYKINCADCSWSYICETGRALETRKKEHKRNVKQCKSGSNIAKHAWTQNHKINFDECETRQPIGTEQHWSPGIQQPQPILTTMHNIYRNNIDFY